MLTFYCACARVRGIRRTFSYHYNARKTLPVPHCCALAVCSLSLLIRVFCIFDKPISCDKSGTLYIFALFVPHCLAVAVNEGVFLAFITHQKVWTKCQKSQCLKKINKKITESLVFMNTPCKRYVTRKIPSIRNLMSCIYCLSAALNDDLRYYLFLRISTTSVL